MRTRIFVLGTAVLLMGLATSAHAQLHRRNTLSFGANFGVNIAGEELAPKYAEYSMQPYGMMQANYYLRKDLFLRGDAYVGTLGSKLTKTFVLEERFRTIEIVSYETVYGGFSAGAGYAFPSVWKFRPLVNARLGLLMHKTSVRGLKRYENNFTAAALNYGVGGALEFMVDRNLSMRLGYDLMLTTTDRLDGIPTGKHNDGMSLFTLGFSWVIRPGEPEPDEVLQDPYGESEAGEKGETEGIAQADLEESAEQDEGLTSAPLFAAEVDDNLFGLRTVLNASPISSLNDLQAQPEVFSLTVRQARDQQLPLKTSFELSRGETLLMRASGSVTLDGKVETFNASEFLDLKTRQLMNRFDGKLPQGNYVVRVVTESDKEAVASVARAGFLNVDLRPIFGSNTDEARERIKEHSVDIALDEDNVLVVNLFSPSRNRRLSEGEMLVMQTGEERDPVRITPVGSGYDQQREYVATHVQESVMEALTLQGLARKDGDPRQLRSTVAEVFFPLDESTLNEEARLVLDYVALHLNRHPELIAEIRGFANDIGDETTNKLLAGRRADRVLEYLVRRQMDNYRLKSHGYLQEMDGINLGNDPRRGRRVEVILTSATL